MMLRRSALAITVAALMAGVVTPAAPAAAAPARLSALDRVYAQAQRTLLALQVYHLTSDTRSTTGGFSEHSIEQRWVDAAHNVWRSVQTSVWKSPGSGKQSQTYRALFAHDIQWYDGTPTSPRTCHHVQAATADLLGCLYPGEPAHAKVVSGRYKGRPALVLVTHAIDYGDASTNRTTTLTYLDPRTALPLATTETGTAQSGLPGLAPIRSNTTYRAERLPRSSLPAGFFTPASLGWKIPDPTRGLPHGLPLYWLGTTWTPGLGLPNLVLQGVDRLKTSTPLYQEILEYAPASDPFGPRVLSIQIWTPKAWAAAHVAWGIPLCKPVSQLAEPIGKVILHCPRPPDGMVASVDAQGAHLQIQPTGYNSGSKVLQSPYNSISALKVVLNALKVRP